MSGIRTIGGGPGLLHLNELRPAMVEALAPDADDDPDVVPVLPDAISPPVLIVEWANPWLEPQTLARLSGYWNARMNVVCIAARADVEAGMDMLQQLVLYTLRRLAANPRSWPVVSVSNPRNFDMAGLTYLGARVTVEVPTTVEGGTTP